MNKFAWRRKFAERVRYCWSKVKREGVPKGLRRKAFADCMKGLRD